MIVVDTNCLVRFFTNDDAIKAEKVKELLDSDKKLYVPEVVFPELEYVLGKQYGASKKDLLLFFQYLVSKKNIKVNKSVIEAVSMYERSKLEIADCIVAAYAVKKKLASFDGELVKVSESKSYWE